MEKDKNSKYWEYMEQNEVVKDAIQPDIGVGKEIILLIYEHNVSQSSWFYNVTQTLQFWFSTILDTVLRVLVHFVAVLQFLLPPNALLKHVGSREGSKSWQQRGRKVEESPRKVMKLGREGG